jgi:hypothetical protein
VRVSHRRSPQKGPARRRGGPGPGPRGGGVGRGEEEGSGLCSGGFFVVVAAACKLLRRVPRLGEGLTERFSLFLFFLFCFFSLSFLEQKVEPLQRRGKGAQRRPRPPFPEALGEGALVGSGAE